MVSRPYRQIAIGLDWLFPRTARRAGLSAPHDDLHGEDGGDNASLSGYRSFVVLQ
jgi:hypothetical protein